MTEPVLLPGNRFRLLREGATPGQYVFVCIANTVSFGRTKGFEDTTIPDCDTPTAIPNRKSVVSSRSWDISFSGTVDPVRFSNIEADFEAEAAHNYQLIFDRPLAGGGRTYTGPIHFESLNVSKTNNGLVNFTATARGDGAYVMASVA